MKRLFDTAVVVENAIAVIVAYEIVWLHSRWHWMTGPREEAVIQRVMVTVLGCSALALLLGGFSLWALRLMKRAGSDDLVIRNAWACVSLLGSGILLLFSLLPITTG
jgi:hypothetical protein